MIAYLAAPGCCYRVIYPTGQSAANKCVNCCAQNTPQQRKQRPSDSMFGHQGVTDVRALLRSMRTKGWAIANGPCGHANGDGPAGRKGGSLIAIEPLRGHSTGNEHPLSGLPAAILPGFIFYPHECYAAFPRALQRLRSRAVDVGFWVALVPYSSFWRGKHTQH